MQPPTAPSQASRICLALMRVGIRMAVGFNQHFDVLGLTQAQFRAVLAVWNCGGTVGVTPTELAEYLFLERATVSVLIRKLIGKELLVQRPGENRRSYRVMLTAKGIELLQRVSPRAQGHADATFEGFAAADVQTFEDMLAELEARLRNGTRETPASGLRAAPMS
jgi:DNA-binding MarR family transcriptional regulator